MSYAFVINGLVRERDRGCADAQIDVRTVIEEVPEVPHLIVRAYDKDLKYDDLMGEARTACDGSFCIVSRVRCRARVWNTRQAVRGNTGHLE